MSAFATTERDIASTTKSRTRPRVADQDVPLKVGDRIDHFTLEKELGRGGMGIVFLAHDTSLDRDVALKVVVPKKSDGTAVERFFREARAQAKLASPHVVHIHFIG